MQRCHDNKPEINQSSLFTVFQTGNCLIQSFRGECIIFRLFYSFTFICDSLISDFLNKGFFKSFSSVNICLLVFGFCLFFCNLRKSIRFVNCLSDCLTTSVTSHTRTLTPQVPVVDRGTVSDNLETLNHTSPEAGS